MFVKDEAEIASRVEGV